MNNSDNTTAILVLIAIAAVMGIIITDAANSPEYIISHPEPGVTCYKKRGADAISCLRKTVLPEKCK